MANHFSKLKQPALLVCLLAISIFNSIATAQTPPPPPLTIVLAGGREFTGEVDERTDAAALWLRYTRGSGVLRRGISWDQIRSASLNGQPVELAQLPEKASRLKSRHIPNSSADIQSRPADTFGQAISPPAVSMDVDVRLANWDADVENDGFILQLTVLDAEGNPVRPRGIVEVELFAPQMRKFHETPQGHGYSVVLTERWTVNLAHHESEDGARMKLPFTAIHPEFRGDMDGIGLVHVKLVVPGSGVIERTVDGVRLRDWSPTRDALQHNSGQRFFSTERTSIGKGAFTPLP